MDLSTLAKNLRSQVDDRGSFTLNDATLGTSDVNSLIKQSPLKGSSITIAANNVPKPSDDTLTVSGAHVSMLSLDKLDTTVTFRNGDDGLTFTVRAVLPKGWTLAKTFPAVGGSSAGDLAFEHCAFVFTTSATANGDGSVGAFANGLNLDGEAHLKEDGPFSIALTLFEDASASKVKMQGPVQSGKHGTVFSLRASVPNASMTLGPVSLIDGFVGMSLAYERRVDTIATGSGVDATLKTTTQWIATPALEVGAHVKVGGKTFIISADIAGGGWLDLSLTANHGLASLSDLAALLGASSSGSSNGKNWKAMLPDELKSLGGFALRAASITVHVGSSTRVESIEATVGLNDWALLSGEIVAQQMQTTWTVFDPGTSDARWEIRGKALATFGAGDKWRFDLDVDLPSLDITADLIHDEKRKYHLGGLIQDVLPASIHVPKNLADIGIAEGYFALSPSSKHLQMYATGAVSFLVYGEKRLAIEGLTFTFDYDGKQASGSLGGELAFGPYAFDVSAELGEGMSIEGSLPKERPVNVVPFLEAVTGEKITLPDAVPNFSVKALSFTANTASKSFTFSGDVSTKWSIPLGAARPSIEVDFSVDSTVKNGARTFQGFVEGTLEIGQHFDVRYDFGAGVSILKGTWKQSGNETIGYKDVGDALNISTSPVTPPKPGMPDLGLVRADLEIDFATEAVTLDAKTDKLGGCAAFVRASKGATVGPEVTSEGWGFVFGVALNQGWTFSKLPKLGPELKEFDFLSFKDASLVIATRKEKITGDDIPVLPDVSMEVVAGLNFGAHIDFSNASKPGSGRADNLHYLLGGDDVFLQGAIGRNLRQTKFTATLEGSVPLPVSKSDIRLGDPFVRVSAAPALSLGGHLKLPIPSEHRSDALATAAPPATNKVDIEGYFLIDAEEADFTVNARFDGDVDHPVGFQGVVLTDIGGSIGMAFEPVGADFKLLATFQIRKPDDPKPRYQSTDEFAFAFNVNPEEYFYPEYLYVKMSTLDLDVIFAALVPHVDLPKPIGSGIRFTDTFVYFCDEPNFQLPDGTTAEVGFGFNGDVHVFDVFEGTAGVMITRTQMHGDFEMTPVHLKIEDVTVLSVTGNTSQGGPKVAFNTKQSPYLDVTADIQLLGLEEALDVYLGNDKFKFAFQYRLVGEDDLKLSCTMTKKGKVHAQGNASVNFDLNLNAVTATDENGNDVTVIPKAHVDADSAAIDVSLDASIPSDFSLAGRLDVYWGSVHFSPHFTLTLQDIKHDLNNLWQAVIAWIKSNLEAFYHAVLQDLDKWAAFIKREFTAFAHDADKVAKALIHYFDAVADDVARILHDLEHDFLTVVKTLVRYFELSFHDAIQIAKKYFGKRCASTLAYTAVMGQQMAQHGPYFRAELAQSESAQPLLVQYYLHEDELRTLLLGHTPAVERRLAEHPDAQLAVSARDRPVAAVLAVLDAVYPDASPSLRDSIDTLRPLIEPHRDATTFGQFVTALDEAEGP